MEDLNHFGTCLILLGRDGGYEQEFANTSCILQLGPLWNKGIGTHCHANERESEGYMVSLSQNLVK